MASTDVVLPRTNQMSAYVSMQQAEGTSAVGYSPVLEQPCQKSAGRSWAELQQLIRPAHLLLSWSFQLPVVPELALCLSAE